MLKRIIFFLLILLVLAFVIGAIYLDKVYLPNQGKAQIVSAIETTLNRKISLESISFHIIKGVDLGNLSIYDTDKTTVFLKVKNISFNVLIWPIFKKAIIIPSLNINGASINLIRDKNSQFNIPIPSGNSKSPFSVLIKDITLNNSRVSFSDLSLAKPFAKEISDIKLKVSLGLDKKISFRLSAKAGNDSNIQNISGIYNLDKQTLETNLKIDSVSLIDYLGYINLPIELKRANLENIETNINLDQKNSLLNVSAQTKINNADFIVQGYESILNADLIASCDYNLKDQTLKYSGALNLDKSQAKNIPYIQEISNIKGLIKFNNEKVSTENLNLFVKNAPVKINFELTEFNNPQIITTLSIDNLDLSFIKEMFKNQLNTIDLKGSSSMSAKITGPINKTDALNINGVLNLTNVQINLPEQKLLFDKLNASISFTRNSLTWEDFKCVYNGSELKSKGTLTDFRYPQIEAILLYNDLRANTTLKIIDKIVQIDNLKLLAFNSSLSADGLISLNKPEELFIKANADIDLYLEDTLKLAKDNANLKQINPKGKINLKIQTLGTLNNFYSMGLNINGSSDLMELYGLKITNATLDYEQKDKILKSAILKANCYDGTVNLNAFADLKQNNIPFEGILDIADINLEKLKMDTAIKNEIFAGTFKTQAKFSGNANSLKDIEADAYMEIKDGYLWGFNPLKKLAEFTSIGNTQEIIFKEATGNFKVREGKANTQDLTLRSENLNIYVTGDVGFDSSLELQTNIELNPTVSKEDVNISSILMGAIGQLTSIKISGTIQDPKYKILPTIPAKNVFKNLKNIFKVD